MGGIYEVRRSDGPRCHDITKIHKDWFSHSKLGRGDTNTHTHTQHRDGISLRLFFHKKGKKTNK
jgi:hypothetical protein